MTVCSPECISEYSDEYGYVWSYTHTPGEPAETLLTTTNLAAKFAADLAVEEGRTHILAADTGPAVMVFILPFGHPMIVQRALNVIKQLLPDGRHIPGPKPQRH
jgi:hypothetical protein